jgi:hypothetical protein
MRWEVNMKLFVVVLTLVVTGSALAKENRLVLSCEKQDFFNFSEPMVVNLITDGRGYKLNFNHSQGSTTLTVVKVGQGLFRGDLDKRTPLATYLRHVDRQTYEFAVVDRVNGRRSITPLKIQCRSVLAQSSAVFRN